MSILYDGCTCDIDQGCSLPNNSVNNTLIDIGVNKQYGNYHKVNTKVYQLIEKNKLMADACDELSLVVKRNQATVGNEIVQVLLRSYDQKSRTVNWFELQYEDIVLIINTLQHIKAEIDEDFDL